MAVTIDAAIKRRAQQTSAAGPDQAEQGTAETTPQTPIIPGVPAQPNVGAPALPSAQVWQNPYPTSFVGIPLASPPANPDLTPQDVAAQVGEYADWDKYITGIGMTAANLSAQTQAQVRAIEQSLSRGLESNDWDTAARGLAQSSIRQNTATDLAAGAATQEGSAISSLNNQNAFLQGEMAKWLQPGGLKETIDNKYLGIGATNRAARVPPPPAPDVPVAPIGPGVAPPASAPPKGLSTPSITQVSPSTPGHPGVYLQDHGPRKGLRYIEKSGVKWYESKAGAGDWGKGGKIGMTP
jgi:hypothetical protein